MFEVFDKCSIPASAHIVARHVKNQKQWTAGTSYFTSATGEILGWEDAVKLLIEAKSHIGLTASMQTKNQSKIDTDKLKIRTMPSDPARKNNEGFAVNWGEQTGMDGEAKCEWVVLWLSTKMEGGRYPWVTAYPVTNSFMTRKGLA